MLLLATGLHDIQFEPGRSLQPDESESFETTVESTVQEIVDIPFWKQILFWVLLISMVVLVASMLSPEMRRWLFRTIIGTAGTVLMVYYLAREGTLSLLNFAAGMNDDAAAASEELPPIPPFSPPEIPPWVNYLISIGVVLVLLLLAWGLSRWLRRLSRPRPVSDSLDDLAAIARSSLDDLQAGQDWDDVIVGCYARMSDTVSRNRGLFRTKAMTPAEFARRLERAGLPGDAVRRLTRLFEAVRYGGRESSQKEINEAVSCLTAILHYCGEAA
ncbi:MAG: DUF4129 domain-containing protein [Anaerolineales bacterium]